MSRNARPSASGPDAIRSEVRQWIAENWDPELHAGRVVGAPRRLGMGRPDLADRMARPRAVA